MPRYGVVEGVSWGDRLDSASLPHLVSLLCSPARCLGSGAPALTSASSPLTLIRASCQRPPLYVRPQLRRSTACPLASRGRCRPRPLPRLVFSRSPQWRPARRRRRSRHGRLLLWRQHRAGEALLRGHGPELCGCSVELPAKSAQDAGRAATGAAVVEPAAAAAAAVRPATATAVGPAAAAAASGAPRRLAGS
jgi:hypothetical protein